MAASRSPHYAAVLRILRYLKGSIFDGLHFPSNSSLTLQAYLDQIEQVIPLITELLQDIVFFSVILLSLGEARNKQLLLVPALKQNIEH